MKLGAVVCYHAAVPAVGHQLRVTIDSLLRHVRAELTGLVIVDDCSPRWPATEAYLAHLEANGLATVLRLGESRTSYYHATGRGPDATLPLTSYGHGISAMRGIEVLRELDCTHVWLLDSDCVILDGGWLDTALRGFSYERVVAVADYYGGEHGPVYGREALDQIADARFEITYDPRTHVERGRVLKGRKPYHLALATVGFPHFSTALVALEALDGRFGTLVNAGVINSHWFHTAMRHGARAAYWPFYQAGHVFHLGSGSTLFSRERWRQGEYRGFGNATDGDLRFGRRNQGCFHACYLRLAIPSTQYVDWLTGPVAALPLGQHAALNPGWLEPPTERATPQPRYFREIEPSDVTDAEALCARVGAGFGEPIGCGAEWLIGVVDGAVRAAVRLRDDPGGRSRVLARFVAEPAAAQWVVNEIIELIIARVVAEGTLETTVPDCRAVLARTAAAHGVAVDADGALTRATFRTARG